MFKKGNSYEYKQGNTFGHWTDKRERFLSFLRAKKAKERLPRCVCGKVLVRKFIKISFCSRCARKRGLV